jgi:hypothetical protein
MLRVAKYSLVAIPLLALFTIAPGCGGKKPPTPPSTDAIDAAGAGVDMPGDAGPVATGGDAGASEGGAPGVPDPTAAPATIALPTATAKIALKGKKPGTVELKSDGTVTSGGKPVGKISGMALQNADGKSLLTVGADGAVTAGEAATAYGSFTGDELTLAKGDKLAIGDDGTITMTTGGKGAPLGKYENLGSAKRAGLLAVAIVVAPPAAEKAATPPKPPGKKPPPKKP